MSLTLVNRPTDQQLVDSDFGQSAVTSVTRTLKQSVATPVVTFTIIDGSKNVSGRRKVCKKVLRTFSDP